MMRRARLFTRLLLSSGVILLPLAGRAWAGGAAASVASYPACGPNKPPAAQTEAAHALYLAGKVAFDEADYEKAILNFRDAYNRDCTKHDLLVIIARAYELRGDKAEAVHALEVYLDRVPNAVDGETHRRRIARLKADLATQPVPSAPPSASVAASTAPPPPAEPPQVPAEPSAKHTVYPWLVVGAGGVVAVTGVVLYLVGDSSFPDGNCSRGDFILASTGSCEGKVDPNDDNVRAGRAQGKMTAGFWSMVGGALLVGGGVTWHFLEPTGASASKTSRALRMAPALTRESAGVRVYGQF